MKYLFPLLLLALGASALHAASEEDVETKLREALRNTMLQLRDAQGQVATLQATQAENETKLKDLEGKFEALTKQSASEKASSESAIATLSEKLTKREEEVSRYKIALDKWKQGYNDASEVARRKELQRAKLAQDLIIAQRRIEDQQRKNDAMFKLGNEILDRYKKFGLGEAIAAKEPFVGVTRVKFQNLIQGYEDKVVEQKIQPTSSQQQPANQQQ